MIRSFMHEKESPMPKRRPPVRATSTARSRAATKARKKTKQAKVKKRRQSKHVGPPPAIADPVDDLDMSMPIDEADESDVELPRLPNEDGE